MPSRSNCVYCGRPLEKKSKEHVIQNALGGLYESENICCPQCNELISVNIDVPFVKIFNGFISRMLNFPKTNKTKSLPPCKGKALCDGQLYDVLIKNGKVVACPELCKKEKRPVTAFEFKIVAYDFPIENGPFKNGISKIAFNFALDKGIPEKYLLKGVKIRQSGEQIKEISFMYPLIPFVPFNPMDSYLELDSRIELYHNLILFSQERKLWCYVDLFNTFQYYVLLSDDWHADETIHESYLQLLQKIDRAVPEIYIRKPKQILIYAMCYGIEPSFDLDIFKKRISTAIQKESLKKEMTEVISSKLCIDYLPLGCLKTLEPEMAAFYLRSMQLYFDEDDKLIADTFRKVTPILLSGYNVFSYPELIEIFLQDDPLFAKSYIQAKFDRLNHFLIAAESAETEEI